MQLFDYLPNEGEHGSLREEPQKPTPNEDASWMEAREYGAYLASLPLYPVSKKMPEWVGRKLQEGIDFELRCQNDWQQEADGQLVKTFDVIQVAIPIEPKERQGDEPSQEQGAAALASHSCATSTILNK